MKRQVGFLPAVGVAVTTLVFGLLGGILLGAAGGMWYAEQHLPAPLLATGAASSSGQTTLSASVSAIVGRVDPAIVTIVNTPPGASPSSQSSQTDMGTGMILDHQGHIVTNNHVIEGGGSLQVIFSDGHTVAATLVGTDAFQDIAVIKVAGPVPATVNFGDSSQLQPGQRVVAIGSALGEFHNTVTEGVVSASGRSLDTGNGYLLENLVQHSAPINPGNSGGPLIDLSGNVVGMNTAIVQGGFGQTGADGLSFAIASNTVRSYVGQLIAYGAIARPYVGITFRPIDQGNTTLSANAQPQPIVVAEVSPGSPATQAGIRVGDQITAVGGTSLDDQHPFLNVLYRYRPGDVVTLRVESGGSTRDVKVTLVARPTT
ncbi:MAG TPA: trypsin-like peptidase domain-containing protein [Thermomicrobiaceae bacterium]|nr:trypsin-like peptidase domain-containing protein [Thermomicrobiaceae bacterium]